VCIVSCLNITVQLSALCAVLYIEQVCVLCCVLSRFVCCVVYWAGLCDVLYIEQVCVLCCVLSRFVCCVVYWAGLCAVLCIEQVCVLCCVLSRFVPTSSGYVAVVYVNIVFSNNYCSNIKWLCNFLQTTACEWFKIFSWQCLMNDEFAKVKYEPKPVLLSERLWRKQQQWEFEVQQVSSEGSCDDLCWCCVNNAILCSQNKASYSGFMHQHMHIVFQN